MVFEDVGGFLAWEGSGLAPSGRPGMTAVGRPGMTAVPLNLLVRTMPNGRLATPT
jgi:hypothetical protein